MLEPLVERYPGNAVFQLLLANLNAEMGRPVKTAEYLQAALKIANRPAARIAAPMPGLPHVLHTHPRSRDCLPLFSALTSVGFRSNADAARCGSSTGSRCSPIQRPRPKPSSLPTCPGARPHPRAHRKCDIERHRVQTHILAAPFRPARSPPRTRSYRASESSRRKSRSPRTGKRRRSARRHIHQRIRAKAHRIQKRARISVCRCDQCAMAVFRGTSSATISKVFTVKISSVDGFR